MDRKKLSQIHAWVKNELKKCTDFWLEHGLDPTYGGVYTCLDRTGKIYSTDKSVWMQGRCAYIFACLCNMYGVKPEWQAASKSCLDFMEKYCFNPAAQDRMYFTVTKDGKPLRQRRYYFSEAFYASANAEYYGLSGDMLYLTRAKKAYDLYWDLWHGLADPTGMAPKTYPETRSVRSFGIPMIYLNVSHIMMKNDPENYDFYLMRANACIDDIFRYHVKSDLKCCLETVLIDGTSNLEVTEGRVVNPGHDIEGVWFILEHARKTGNKDLIPRAEEIFKNAIKSGWDPEYGGLLYFVDACGLPPESYEHDMKLWWPHNEILIASLMLYQETGKQEYLDWFYQCVRYCQTHFSDPEYGEWYGYLRRDGKPTMPPAKGSTFKGPFHLPRSMMLVDQMLSTLLEDEATIS